METKRCGACRKQVAINDFNKNPTKKDGVATMCKKCQSEYGKRWYQKNKERHKENTARRTRDTRKKNIRYMVSVKAKGGCIDCGEHDPIVLEFDHINGNKHHDVSMMAGQGYALITIKEEIAKCEIVCANCHRRRTAARNKSHWSHNYQKVKKGRL